jgi:hypothetical protein
VENPPDLPKPNINLPCQRKNQLNPRANSPLAGPPASRVSVPAYLSTSFEPSHKGSRNISDSLKTPALGYGHRPTHNITTVSSEPRRLPHMSPPRPRPASDAAPPLVHSRPPITSPMFLRQPTRQARNGSGQITTPSPITAWGRAAGHYATHTSTIRTIQAYAVYEMSLWATIPSNRVRSHHDSRLRGLSPLRRSNPKDRHVATGIITTLHDVATTSIEPHMSRHVTYNIKGQGSHLQQ